MQHVFIIRHGERLDNVDYNWVVKSSRPYDPPITNDGEKEVIAAAERFKDVVCVYKFKLCDESFRFAGFLLEVGSSISTVFLGNIASMDQVVKTLDPRSIKFIMVYRVISTNNLFRHTILDIKGYQSSTVVLCVYTHQMYYMCSYI